MALLSPFEIHAATTVADASEHLDRLADDAVVYAGGTELLLVMKLGFAEYGHLVDIKTVDGMSALVGRGDHLAIGACVTHRQIERSEVVRRGWPALAEMERMVANVRVRTAGTLGGNLCFADPHSDPGTFLLAAEASLLLRKGAATRVVAMGDFVKGPYETAIEPGELLTEIRAPALPSGAAMSHHKFSVHERPAATVTCLVRLDGGHVVEVRLAVGSVGVVPVRARGAEQELLGSPDDAAIARAAESAAAASGAVEDANGAPDYKRQLVRVLVGRAFREARERAAAKR